MQVLFYLPVVTPWWFERIVIPLMEKLTVDYEVHILAPIFWQGTGFGQDQYDLCEHLPHIKWHIVNDSDHRSMRTDAVQKEQIIEFVRALNPDFVLCRSADLEITKRFPGIVRPFYYKVVVHHTPQTPTSLVCAPLFYRRKYTF